MFKIICFMPLLCRILSFPAFCQDLTFFSQSITAEELHKHIEYLSSDELCGRNTGDPGQKLAAGYIKDQLKSLNIPDPVISDENYYQRFELFGRACSRHLLCTEHDTLDNLKEYLMDNGEMEFEGDRHFNLVFLGYGREKDYVGKDVKGKLVMYFNGYPAIDSIPSKKYLSVTDEKYKRAREHGAIGAIKLFKEADSAGGFIRAISGFTENRMQFDNPFQTGIDSVIPNAIGALPMAGSRLLGIPYETLLQNLNRLDEGKPIMNLNVTDIHIVYQYRNYLVQTENVLGLIEGKEHPEEVVVVMAHYDHLGSSQGNIFHGANDNASGTAAVLEVARALSEMSRAGYRPEKSILFLLVTGEEKGLLGSRYYVDNPVFPLIRTKAVVNLDMLGRCDFRHRESEQYIYIDLPDSAGSPVHRICESVKAALGLDSLALEYGFQGKTFAMGNSDHMSFSSGVPYVYYYNGIHSDWHKPSDTADKIDYKNLMDITRHVYATVWNLANSKTDLH